MSDITEVETDKSRQRWRTIAWVGGFVLSMALGLWVIDRKTTPRMIDGPMVQLVGPDGFTVVWEARPCRPGELIVQYSGGEKRAKAERNEVGYQAAVHGLPASSEVRYRIRHRSLVGKAYIIDEATTRTAKNPGQPFRFLVFGDSGSGGFGQRALAELMERQNADLILHVGDLVYQTGHPAYYGDNFYKPNAGLIRSVPFYPVLGNHDIKTENGRPFLRRFVLPANGPPELEPERNFAVQYADALFVGLDSTLDKEALAGQVAPWLEDVLASAETRWKFVYFHHTPYTGCTKHAPDANMQEAIVPVMERGGVDMVFAGHNHLYERTLPIFQGKISNQQGIVYIVTGAGGMSKYPEAADPPAYIAAHDDQDFSFTMVDIAGDQLRLRQISEWDKIIDEYALTQGM